MQVNGYRCDVCKTFELRIQVGGSWTLPLGWITITPKVKKDQTNGVLQVCGDRCHTELAIARYEALQNKKFIRSKAEVFGKIHANVS